DSATSLPGIMIADEMGLGKTITSIGIALLLKERFRKEGRVQGEGPWARLSDDEKGQPLLIVVLAFLESQWADQLDAFTKPLHLVRHKSAIVTPERCNTTPQTPVHSKFIHLITYETFRSRWEDGSLRGCRFSIGIFDESHTAKTPKSAIVKHLTQLGTDCPLR